MKIERSLRVKLLKGIRKHFVYLSTGCEVVNFITPIYNRWSKVLPYTEVPRFSLTYHTYLESAIYNDDKLARMVLTIVWASRELNLEPTLDLDTITLQTHSQEKVDAVNLLLKDNINKLGLPRSSYCDNKFSIK